MSAPATSSPFNVELPAGGAIKLNNAEEVDLWEGSAKRYIEDYGITKQNDLVLVGACLTHQLTMYRAQQALTDAKKASTAQNTIIKAATEIRELEKALGIDKKTREQGGQHTVADYIGRLKRAGHVMGVHVNERFKMHEAFANDLRTRIRILRNGDDEDRAYHGISPEKVVEWAERELEKIEEADKDFAKNKARLFVGRL